MPEFKRFIETCMQKALNASRIVLLTGARQTGKTTFLKTIESPIYQYRTLDNPIFFHAAKDDPMSFLPKTEQKMIIDEIQRVPELLPILKMRCDENNEKGRYLLTGSADVTALPDAQESLAGRVRKIRMRGLCQAEIENNLYPSFLDKLFGNKDFKDDPNLTKNKVIQRAIKGGFPEAVLSEDYHDRDAWYRSYVDALMTRDLQDILQIRRFDIMRQLFPILASWSSKELHLSDVASKLAVSRPTLESYIGVLCLMYICDRLPSWLETDYDRVAKHDKIFMTDCGLMASLLDWIPEQIEMDSDKCGKLIETFVYNELSSLISFSVNDDYSLYHYRDRQKREIDFIIKNRKIGHLVGVEVKAGSTVRPDSFKHLKWFKDNIAGDKPFSGIILYTGTHYVSYAHDMHLVPMSALWT